MKAYGHSRRDKLECRWGCCTGKSGPERSCRKAVDRANRKTARQDQAAEVVDQLKGGGPEPANTSYWER